MSAILSYSIDIGDTDYPVTYEGLLAFLDPYIDDVIAGRQGQASLAANFARYIRADQGLTQNLTVNGFRVTGLQTPVSPSEPATKSFAESLAFSSALPAISADTYGESVTNDGATADWGMSSAESIAVLGNLFNFY